MPAPAPAAPAPPDIPAEPLALELPDVPLVVPVPLLVVVPLVVVLGTPDGSVVVVGTWLGNVETDGTLGEGPVAVPELFTAGGVVITVVTPGVVGGVTVVLPERPVWDCGEVPAGGPTRRGGAALSGSTQVTSRSEQKSGMLVRSVSSAAVETLVERAATAAATANTSDFLSIEHLQ